MKIKTGKYKIVFLLSLVFILTAIILTSLFFFKEAEENQKEPILYEEIDVEGFLPSEDEIYCTYLTPPFERKIIIKSKEEFDLHLKSVNLSGFQDFTKSSISLEPEFKDVDSNKFSKICSKYYSIEDINFDEYFLVGDILSISSCSSNSAINFNPEAFTNTQIVKINPKVAESACESSYLKGYLLALPKKFIEYNIQF